MYVLGKTPKIKIPNPRNRAKTGSTDPEFLKILPKVCMILPKTCHVIDFTQNM